MVLLISISNHPYRFVNAETCITDIFFYLT